MEANDYRHTEEIASVLSQDDHFVDASTHKVNSSLRTDHVLSPALLYIIFPKEQLFSHLPSSAAHRAVVFPFLFQRNLLSQLVKTSDCE